jgi:hypothetical protein
MKFKTFIYPGSKNERLSSLACFTDKKACLIAGAGLLRMRIEGY